MKDLFFFFPNFLQIFSRCYCNSLSFCVPAVTKCLQIRWLHSPPASKTMQWPWYHPLSHSAQEFSYSLTPCRYKWELAWPIGSDHIYTLKFQVEKHCLFYHCFFLKHGWTDFELQIFPDRNKLFHSLYFFENSFFLCQQRYNINVTAEQKPNI